MEVSIQSFTLNTSLVLTGLSAGLLYAWSVSVIPGTQRVDSFIYLTTMQCINRAIINPAFFLIFFGSLLMILTTILFTWDLSNRSFWYLLGAFISYGVGTVLVTGLGNVQLNNELDGLQLQLLTEEKMDEFRAYYEFRWNRLHAIRMVFSVVSFILLLLSLNSNSNNS